MAQTQPASPSAAVAPARFHESAVRVTYADTDKMGVVYYANYFRFFEQGRTELLRSLGARYRDLERDRKLYLPVAEAACRYVSPGRYDELLRMRTWISSLGKASLSFAYEVRDAENPERRVAVGVTRHALVNDLWRPTRLPDDLRATLEPYLGPEAFALQV